VNNLYREKLGVDYNENWECVLHPDDVAEYMTNWRLAREVTLNCVSLIKSNIFYNRVVELLKDMKLDFEKIQLKY
jgi:hypothetical protein